MKASELRIGNYVNGLSLDHKKKIKDKIAVIKQYGWETINGFQGIEAIPLDEEWLLRFGFEKLNRDVPAFERKNLIVEWLFERWTGRLYYDYRESIQIIEVKSVHQLQNLYFALTGEELTIKQ